MPLKIRSKTPKKWKKSEEDAPKTGSKSNKISKFDKESKLQAARNRPWSEVETTSRKDPNTRIIKLLYRFEDNYKDKFFLLCLLICAVIITFSLVTIEKRKHASATADLWSFGANALGVAANVYTGNADLGYSISSVFGGTAAYHKEYLGIELPYWNIIMAIWIAVVSISYHIRQEKTFIETLYQYLNSQEHKNVHVICIKDYDEAVRLVSSKDNSCCGTENNIFVLREMERKQFIYFFGLALGFTTMDSFGIFGLLGVVIAANIFSNALA